jgi:predicted CoA-substrate-specific enzyme activase
MQTLGICFGATAIQYVILHADEELNTIVSSGRRAHEGNVVEALLDLLDGIDLAGIDRVAVTGRGFREKVALSSIAEPQAVERALLEECRDGVFPDLVVSIGGETQVVYKIDRRGAITSVLSGGKCASGTGEFFLQQIRRMGYTIEQAVDAAEAGQPHRIAGRCSVFCKSDCTHALNKGEPRENIAAGLCLMMADKISELIKDVACNNIAVIGGGSLNHPMVEALRERYTEVVVPERAECFEAYGAALWASENLCRPLPNDIRAVVVEKGSSFDHHPALAGALHLVDTRHNQHDSVRSGDICILGLDVGSTTTKAVLIRLSDRKILASVYLRTNGNPIEASRKCYAAIHNRIGTTAITIVGLGVTGSGRQIAGLHALTNTIINEIIAHATAAAYFDPEVDTIFEIGGQDAKYTFLTAGVPSDYAMNEACSAGTGSFLEEAARESLNIATEHIGEQALLGKSPPNFTDQCAAFISSDIKRAGHEGISKEDILAGLVYSVCLNYLNRVKGSRSVGKKIFMQGGVCYNRAVPVAMAELMQARIVVPPDPGLMGAFGVALEVAKRIELGLVAPGVFDLALLEARVAEREGSFICAGGREKCDRKCEISRIRVAGTLFAFGGACDRYFNQRLKKEVKTEDLDLVAVRQRLIFKTYGPDERNPPHGADERQRTIGLNLSFLTHSLYPLFSNFFTRLGYEVVVPEKLDKEGVARAEAAFCLPAEISHAAFFELLRAKCDYLFLPQVMQVPVANVPTYSRICVFVQGEPYYLKTTFRREIETSGSIVLDPVLKMQYDYEDALQTMVALAVSMGASEKEASKAYVYACEKQRAFEKELLRLGNKALYHLEKNPDTLGIVLFGRPYNAFAAEANMGIPHKIASRGYLVIPHDMLPAADYTVDGKMFWAMGQKIMKAAQFTAEWKNLFGVYITNFSCGPDSFMLGYFRDYMGAKPSLTLELDQHTADAGIDTRIDAALDIMTAWRSLKREPAINANNFVPARIQTGSATKIHTSDGRVVPLTDPSVEVILPSMGHRVSVAIAAVLRGKGMNAIALPVAAKEELLQGKKVSSCKECLPYLVTSGSFLTHLEKRPNPATVTVCLMATGGGPCRLGQYYRAFEKVIEKRAIPNAVMLPLTDENGYLGLGGRVLLKSWQAIVLADVFEDIRSMLSAAAIDPPAALAYLESLWRTTSAYFEGRLSIRFSILLRLISDKLKAIPLVMDPRDVPVVSLVGEIFVRRDEFSRKNIVDYLERHGFMARIAPLSEYPCYSNYVVRKGLGEREFSFHEHFKMRLTSKVQAWWERQIKSIMAGSGLYFFEMNDVEATISGVDHLLNHNFRGECILTVGLGMREILHDSCGIISIGPFGCMPSRIAEAMLKKELNVAGKRRMRGWEKRVAMFEDLETFPLLAIETDGNPFPQLVQANLEAFVLQARRLHERMMEAKGRAVVSKTVAVEDVVVE